MQHRVGDGPRPERIVVLHLVLNLEVGGLEVLVVNLLERMTRGRYVPVACCLDSKGALGESVEDRGVKVLSLHRRPGFDFSVVTRLARVLKENGVTILHTHNWTAHVYGSLASLIARVPVVIHTQHGDLTSFTWKGAFVRPFLGRLVDQFCAVSPDVSRFATTSGWVSPQKVQTVLNGIDPAMYTCCGERERSRIRKELGVPPDAQVIVNVARLSEEKDHRTLLRAFRSVRAQCGDVFLVIVGDGPLMTTLQAMSRDSGMEAYVRFTGMRGDVPALLHASDLFALSSRTEGIAVSLLEAMAAGLPVVATHVGGNAEVVVHGQTGILVPPQQPEQFADALTRVLRDEEWAKDLGGRGRERVSRDFSLDRMMAQYLALYDTLLVEKGLQA